jgi:hypothetical protein
MAAGGDRPLISPRVQRDEAVYAALQGEVSPGGPSCFRALIPAGRLLGKDGASGRTPTG